MTFAVLAPEHPLVGEITTPERRAAVDAYCRAAARRSEVERQQAGRDGVNIGAYAINPVNGERVPVYVADYVLMNYGGGAIMGVPAHDERDLSFAMREGLPAPVVVAPPDWDGRSLQAAYTDPGTMIHSGPWDGLPSLEARERIAGWMEQKGIGRRVVNYRMRDWLISRQRYWGAPIPIVYCDQCGIVPVPEGDLPVLLPHIDAWRPGQDGRSPLANVPAYVHTPCPQCGGAAYRETDTMDGFACSSWYYLRFVSPDYAPGPFDPVALAQWGPPDLYVGGAEHAVMHLLYARFWTKVMADAGVVPFREPFPVLRSQGVMHARDVETGQARRMSKTAGNVVTPDEVAEVHGADALRVYLLFMAPFESNTVWDEDGIVGARRFLDRVWRLADDALRVGEPSWRAIDTELEATIHRAIQRVTADVEAFKFNTAVSALMECLNTMYAHRQTVGATEQLLQGLRTFVLLLAPFAPHLTEEIWARLGEAYSVHQQAWPTWDETALVSGTITLVVQVDGRVRDRVLVPAEIDRREAQERALACDGVHRYLAGRQVARVVYVPGKLVNVVTRQKASSPS
jgi:leucyl-tRNA synthetase